MTQKLSALDDFLRVAKRVGTVIIKPTTAEMHPWEKGETYRLVKYGLELSLSHYHTKELPEVNFGGSINENYRFVSLFDNITLGAYEYHIIKRGKLLRGIVGDKEVKDIFIVLEQRYNTQKTPNEQEYHNTAVSNAKKLIATLK